MEKLRSFVGNEHVEGKGIETVLVNPTTEEEIAHASAAGVDFERALSYARDVGGPALRALSFAARGEILRACSKAVHAAREELIELGVRNAGNTRSDAKFDVDGASGTLMAYADLATGLGDGTFFVDGDAIPMGRSSRVAGQHVWVPREGVAVHINAFNFPAWGLAEKMATTILAGLPIVAKPATPTAWMTAVMVDRLVATNALPPGALSLIVGEPRDLLAHVRGTDVVAFTGSSRTGAVLRALPSIVQKSVHLNVEADSLNAAILGPDVEEGSDTWDLFLADVARDATQKAGQKCTAIRRVLVPQGKLAAVVEALGDRVGSVKVGDPAQEGVNVGPVVTAAQRDGVKHGIEALSRAPSVRVAVGGPNRPKMDTVPNEKGYFVAPTLLVADDADAATAVHELEVFGPVVTVMPYRDAAHAVAIVRRGEGGLVASLYSDDRALTKDVVFGLAPFHGRLTVGSLKVAGATAGPGTVFPQFVHGGPGRAGGGEELGGLRGVMPYLQRVAVQGYGPMLDAIFAGGTRLLSGRHAPPQAQATCRRPAARAWSTPPWK